MKTWIKVTLPLVLLIAAAGLYVARGMRKPAATLAAPVAASAASAQQVRDLSTLDVLTIHRVTLAQGLEVSGTLKAVNTATVKAKVAAELTAVTVREGDAVRAGQVVAQLDTTEYDLRLRQAEQQAIAARTQLDIAKRQSTNNKALVAQGFISPTALETSLSSEAGAQATLQAALAGVELAKKSLADTRIATPINGLVSQRLAQPGERVAVDGKILEIVDLGSLELEAAVPPENLAALKVGAQAKLTVDGSPEPASARVMRINPSAQAGSRTVSAYLAVAPSPGLRNGLFARGWIELLKKPVLAIPVSAVRTDAAKPYAIRVSNGRADPVELTLGLRGRVDGQRDGQDMVEVLAGLNDGDKVLAASAGLVPRGVTLRIAANPNDGPQPAKPAASTTLAASLSP